MISELNVVILKIGIVGNDQHLSGKFGFMLYVMYNVVYFQVDDMNLIRYFSQQVSKTIYKLSNDNFQKIVNSLYMLQFQIVIYRMSKHHSLNGYESKGHVGSIPFHLNTKYTKIYCSGSKRIHNQIWQCSNSKYYNFAINYWIVYDDLFCPQMKWYKFCFLLT